MRLLADIREAVPLIIGIIALISWVANKIKASSNANAGGVVADAPGEEAGGHPDGSDNRHIAEKNAETHRETCHR